MRTTVVATVAFLLAAPAARAADGVIEINQARALAGGVTPGDTPGFPVTLSQSGSYVLTSELTVASTSTSAIVVLASDVSIDLGGFTVAGPMTCSGLGSAMTCTPATSSRGIDGAVRERIRVEHGNVRGFGFYGVYVGSNSSIRSVVATSNGTGLRVANSSEVLDSIAFQNQITGITTGSDSVVSRNVSRSNLSHGIYSGGYGTSMTGNVVNDNGGIGIVTTLQCVVSNNIARVNESHGIDVGSGSVVHDNLASDNTESGITTGTASSVQRNSVYSNTGVGIVLGTGTGYRENTIHSNTGGTVSGGVSMGNNLCDGSAVCP